MRRYRPIITEIVEIEEKTLGLVTATKVLSKVVDDESRMTVRVMVTGPFPTRDNTYCSWCDKRAFNNYVKHGKLK